MNTKLAMLGAGAALALTMGVSGCTDQSSAQSGMTLTGSKYCTPFKPTSANANASALADPASAFDDCVHRWAYTLAPAHDPADVVARAAVDACGPLLTAWNQQTLTQNPDQGQTPYQSRRMDMRGGEQQSQANNPMAQRMGMVEGRALFYVVQSRAAGCAAPPASTLMAMNGMPG